MIKLFSLLFFLLFLKNTHAETCPTIADIKAGYFHGWQALDIDNAEPISSADLNRYRRKVATLAFVQWVPDAPEGSGECFYHGKIPDVDYLGVFLVKQTLAPDKRWGNWHEENPYVTKCTASINECRFLDEQ